MNDQLLLNRYRLVERLASGGSAEVWRAEDEQLGRPVAVKRLHPHLMPDEASRKRLVAEARAAAGLSHPVIVGIYDVDATGEAPAIVMELVEGESLGARIRRDGPLRSREAAAITADLAEALFHAHQRGVIHRDVKPGNVLLAEDGRTRLVDFGIAHSLAKNAERLTLTGTVIGTLSAMAPEQLAGGEITPRTDLYGLGVVLHEALTGRPPYPASSPLALADAQRGGPLALTEVEPALAAVMAACLAYDPGDRPLHAGALATALRQWLDGDPSAALAMAPVPPVPAADTDEITRPVQAVAPRSQAEPAGAAGAAPARTPPRGSRPWLLALLAGLIGLVLVAAMVMVNGDLTSAPGGEAATPTPTLVPTAAPTATVTPVPEWLREQVSKVAEDCGPEVAAQYEAQAAGMEEKQAEELAEQLRDQCRDQEGGGNGNGGNGGRGGRGGGGDD